MARNGRKAKRPSMKDVAERAGVSRTTVSFVINRIPDSNIPPKTQARVWTAVNELNYRPNALARGLRSRRTDTVGLILDGIATTPHTGRIVLGAQELAWEHNKLLLLINTGSDQDMKRAAIDAMLDRQVEGIVYASMVHRRVHPPDSIRQVPTVLLDCFTADASLPSVVPDEVIGGYEATRLLLENRHRRIGFINKMVPIPAPSGRLAGYKRALFEQGVRFDEALVSPQVSDAGGGHNGAMKLMARTPRPTALLCFNERMAMGAYDALRRLDLSIPEDVAVVGFDNQELIAANLYPALTTIELPHYEMGRWALAHLLKLIQDADWEQAQPIQHLFPCPLIKRESA